MKIRNGFVSNSSSSSFIVKGFILDASEYDCEEVYKSIAKQFEDKFAEKLEIYQDEYEAAREVIADSNTIYVADNEEMGAPKNKIIVGELLQDTGSDDYYFNDASYDCEMSETVQKIKDLISPDEDLELKFIVGTRLS